NRAGKWWSGEEFRAGDQHDPAFAETGAHGRGAQPRLARIHHDLDGIAVAAANALEAFTSGRSAAEFRNIKPVNDGMPSGGDGICHRPFAIVIDSLHRAVRSIRIVERDDDKLRARIESGDGHSFL